MIKGVTFVYLVLGVHGCGDAPLEIYGCWVQQDDTEVRLGEISSSSSRNWESSWKRWYHYLRKGDPNTHICVAINPSTSEERQTKIRVMLTKYQGITHVHWSPLAEDVEFFAPIGRYYF